MGIEQAMVFVGHRFRIWHLRYPPEAPTPRLAQQE
jgi:hypothetical protein